MKKLLSILVIAVCGIILAPNVVSAKEIIEITNLELVEKSDNATIVKEGKFKNLDVDLNVKFKYVNDYVKYKLTLHNNDTNDYKINLEDEELDYIKYSYEYNENFEANKNVDIILTIKYTNEAPDDKLINNKLSQSGAIKFKINGKEINNDISDSNNIEKTDNSTEKVDNPQTYDGIIKWIIIGIISVVGLILSFKYRKKLNKKIIVPIIAICMISFPISTFALSEVLLNITVNIEIEKDVIYNVNYSDDIQQYSSLSNPLTVVEGTTLTATFTGTKDNFIFVKLDDKILKNGESYNGSTFNINNGVASVTNITSDVTFAFNNSVEIYLGDSYSLYKSSNYRDLITSIDFVDYIDLDNADASWDITTDETGLAYAWIESTKLYIGSDFILRPTDLSMAFSYMKNVKEINFNDKLDTSKVKYMSYMFSGTGLTSIDLSKFDTSNVLTMDGMFSSMKSLTSLDLSSFDISNVVNTIAMFNNDSSLTKIYISNKWNINIDKLVLKGIEFNNCTSLSGLISYDPTKTSADYATLEGYLTLKQ